MSVTALVVQLLLIAFFAPSAVLKLAGHAHMRKEFRHFRYPYWLARLAGTMELVASALLVAGFWHPAASVLGAGLLVPVMVGATWTNFVKRPAAFGWGTAVILLLCVGLAAYRAVQLPPDCFASVSALLACAPGAAP